MNFQTRKDPRIAHAVGAAVMTAFLGFSTFPAKADIAPHGANAVIDTTTGFVWLNLTQTQNMSFLAVSAQLAPGGLFAGYQYASVTQVETFWADAGLTGPSLGCTPSPVCLAETVPLQAADNFVSLLGNTWLPSYGFQGNIGLTSTPYTSPWPGCAPYTCYVTPEIRINDGTPADTLIVEGLRDYIADPIYGSWLVNPTVQAQTPEPSYLQLIGAGLTCLFVLRRYF